MKDKIFVGLHNHSFFSIGDGISRPDEMAKRAKDLGMNSLAITEHGNLASSISFMDGCKKHGIKPIFGIEAYFVDDQKEIFIVNEKLDKLKETEKQLKKNKEEYKKYHIKLHEIIEITNLEKAKLRKYNHLILLARNKAGFEALIKMNNSSIIDGFYGKNRIDWKTLETFVVKGDIIAGSACLGGRTSRLILNNEYNEAKAAALRFNSIFGQGNFFIELQLNELDIQKQVNIEQIRLSEELNIPLYITCDSHSIDESGLSTRALIRQLGQEDYANNDDKLKDLYIKNEDMLLKSWNEYMPEIDKKYLAEAIKNTRRIADSVELFEFDSSLKFPIFDTGKEDINEYLKKEALRGLIARNLHKNPEYIERLKTELKTIEKLGFASYFLTVADIVKNQREIQSIGTARGSAAGSILSYVLGITNVDSIKHELFFERFLSVNKGLLTPTFGLNINALELDKDKILKECPCHK